MQLQVDDPFLVGTPNVVRTNSLDVYQRTVNDSFVPLKVSSIMPGPFTGVLTSSSAADMHFTQVGGSAQLVERTHTEIEAGGNNFYKFSLLLAGSSIITQDGREVVSQPGDLSFYDTSRPYSLLFDGDFMNLILMFPKSRIELPSRYADSLTAVALGAQHPISDVISKFFTQSAPHIANLTGTARTKLAQSSLSLINTILSAVCDFDTEVHHPHDVLREKIQTFIDDNLRSRDLSPDSIAAAHFISTRHLHALFQYSGTSISAYIRSQRLERCAQALTSTAWAQYSISVIAHRWGFTDAAHFSRTFRKTFGCTPREYRLDRPVVTD